MCITLLKNAVWILQKAFCWIPCRCMSSSLRISKESLITIHRHWCGIQTGSLMPISVHELEIVLCLPYGSYKPQARFVLFLCCYFAANRDRLYSHKHQKTEFPVQTRSILYPPAPPHKSQKQLQVICTQNQAKQLLQKPKPLILAWVALNFTQ